MQKRMTMVLAILILLVVILPVSVFAADLPAAPGLYAREIPAYGGEMPWQSFVNINYPDTAMYQFMYFDGEKEIALTAEDLAFADFELLFAIPNGDSVLLKMLDFGKTNISYTAPDGTVCSISVTAALPELGIYTAPEASVDTYCREDVWNTQQYGDTLYVISTMGRPIAKVSPLVFCPTFTYTLSEDRMVAAIKLEGEIPETVENESVFRCTLEDGDGKRFSMSIFDRKFMVTNLNGKGVLTEDTIQYTVNQRYQFFYYEDGKTTILTEDDLYFNKDGVVWFNMNFYGDGTADDAVTIYGEHCGTVDVCYKAPDGMVYTFPLTVQIGDIALYYTPYPDEDAWVEIFHCPITSDGNTLYLISESEAFLNVTSGENWPESIITISDDKKVAKIEIIGGIGEGKVQANLNAQLENGNYFGTGVFFNDYRGHATSGNLGEGITWKYDNAYRSLTIGGIGRMPDFAFDNENIRGDVPWGVFMNTMRHVVLEEGVEYLGENSLSGCDYLRTIKLPESLVEISESAFWDTANNWPLYLYYAGSKVQWDEVRMGQGNAFDEFTLYCDYVEPVPNPFHDVSEDDWFFAPVMWAVENNVTGGTSPVTFSPNEPCTRAAVVTFLWAANGKPEPALTENPFTDVTETDWYYKAVMWAVENGITGGTSATTFSPDHPCTRAQVVTFLYAAQGKPSVQVAVSEFSDVSDTAWYLMPVLWAKQNEVTGGVAPGLFGPEQTCTRAQIATFLYKAIG